MRKILTLEAGAAAAMAEFNTHLTSPSHPSAPPPSPSKCDARTCPWWPYSNSNDFKANTALIIVILFCALICSVAFNAAIRYVIRVHCGRGRRGDEEDQKAETAEKEEIEVPVVIYTEGMKLTRAEAECIICLSEFVVGDKIQVLEKCDHGFHLQCVQKWLALHSSCPTCRTDCCSTNVESKVSLP